MNLIFIRTENISFIVNDVTDELREKMGLVYGKSLKLFCEEKTTIYKGKERIVHFYSDYVSEKNIQVCKESSILEKRLANSIEKSIFLHINNKQKLSDSEKDYLRENFYIA